MAGKSKLNEDQTEAFKAIQKFIEHPSADTFILKGYAGTGKTFLMQHLAKWLKEKKYKFSLLASTGRAAAVLRGKTGLTTKTVHSELYNFSKVDGADDAKAGHVTVISAATDTVVGDIVINPVADTGFKAAGDALQREEPLGQRAAAGAFGIGEIGRAAPAHHVLARQELQGGGVRGAFGFDEHGSGPAKAGA